MFKQNQTLSFYSSNPIYIIKSYPTQQYTPQQIANINQRFSILQKIHHPNLQQIIFVSQNKSSKLLHIVYSKFQGRPLKSYLGKLTKFNIIRIFYYVKRALKELFKHNLLIHGNINLQTILINQSNFKPCLTQFLIFPNSKKLTTHYDAPETIILKEIRFKSDYWSLGIVLLQLILGMQLNEFRQLKDLKIPKLQNKLLIREINLISGQFIQFKQVLNGLLAGSSTKRHFVELNLQINLNKEQKKIVNKLKSFIYSNGFNMNNGIKQELRYIKYLKAQNMTNMNIINMQIQDVQFLNQTDFYDLASISISHTKLNIKNQQFSNKYLQNLLILNLDKNQITNIVPLIKLNPYITKISLSNNLISNIQPLKKMKFEKLTDINLQLNKIQDIEELVRCEWRSLKTFKMSTSHMNIRLELGLKMQRILGYEIIYNYNYYNKNTLPLNFVIRQEINKIRKVIIY